MKCILTLILFVSVNFAQTTWYFSSSGSDGNNGTSSSTPKKNLYQIFYIGLSAGDSVLLKRGDTFTYSGSPPNVGMMRIPETHGDWDTWTYFGAYGDGADPKPKISDENCSGYWETVRSGALSFAIFDSLHFYAVKGGEVNFRANECSDYTVGLQHVYFTNCDFYGAGANPYSTWQGSTTRPPGTSDHPDPNEDDVGTQYPVISHIRFEYCTFDSTVKDGGAINWTPTGDSFYVGYCTITGSAEEGIDIAGGDYHTIEYNKIYGANKQGIKLHSQFDHMTGVVVRGNLIVKGARDYGGYPLALEQISNSKIYNNTVIGATNGYSGILWERVNLYYGWSEGNEIFNNIFQGVFVIQDDYSGNHNEYQDTLFTRRGNSFHHNTYWGANPYSLVVRFTNRGIDITETGSNWASQWTDYAGTTNERYKVTFTDEQASYITNYTSWRDYVSSKIGSGLGTFTPTNNVLENGAAVPASYTVDIDGNPICSTPDRGAYQVTACSPYSPYIVDNISDIEEYIEDSLSAGDTLFIRGGTYYPTSVIQCGNSGSDGNRIVVTNYGDETVIFDLTNLSAGTWKFIEVGTSLANQKNYWTFEGLQFKNSQFQNGCILTRYNFTTIQNCTFDSLGQAAIMVWGGNNTLIRGNSISTMTRDKNAIDLYSYPEYGRSCDNSIVEFNYIAGADSHYSINVFPMSGYTGVFDSLTYIDNLTIRYNYIEHGNGMFLRYIRGAKIYGNVVVTSHVGIHIEPGSQDYTQEPSLPYTSNGIFIYNNTFIFGEDLGYTGDGIIMDYCTDEQYVKNNIFAYKDDQWDATREIYIVHPNTTEIENNSFYNKNGAGDLIVRLSGSSYTYATLNASAYGEGNIWLEPAFVDSGTNWSLQDTSSLIDAGTTLGSPFDSAMTATSFPTTDYTLIYRTTPDIGAYEYDDDTPTPPDFEITPTSKDFGELSLGSELLTDPTFQNWTDDDLDDWAEQGEDGASNNVTENSGCQFQSDGSWVAIKQYTICQNGASYIAETVVSDVTSGSIKIVDAPTGEHQISSTGTDMFSFLADATSYTIARYQGGGCDVTITSASVKQITTDNTQSFTITNDGDEALIGTATLKNGDNFELISGGTINTTTTHAIGIKYLPQSEGTHTDSIIITHNSDSVASPYYVSLSGSYGEEEPDFPILRLGVPEVDFGIVDSGSTSDSTLYLYNDGDEDLHLLMGIEDSVHFLWQSGSQSDTVSAGDSVGITLRFAPDTSGALDDYLTITHNAPTVTGSPEPPGDGDGGEYSTNIPLSGTGKSVNSEVSNYAITPSEWDAGDILVGTNKYKWFYITNEGSANLVGYVLFADSSVFQVSSGGTFDTDGQHILDVRFSPDSVKLETDTIFVYHNAPNAPSPDTLIVEGRGSGGDPYLSVINNLLFYPVAANTSAYSNITLENNGEGELVISSVTMRDSTVFTISREIGSSIPAGQSDYITIKFTPTSEGNFTDELYIESDSPTSIDTVNIRGSSMIVTPTRRKGTAIQIIIWE